MTNNQNPQHPSSTQNASLHPDMAAFAIDETPSVAELILQRLDQNLGGELKRDLEQRYNTAMNVPLAQIEVTPFEAEYLGAFEEDALSEEDALQCAPDLLELLSAEQYKKD